MARAKEAKSFNPQHQTRIKNPKSKPSLAGTGAISRFDQLERNNVERVENIYVTSFIHNCDVVLPNCDELRMGDCIFPAVGSPKHEWPKAPGQSPPDFLDIHKIVLSSRPVRVKS